MSSQELVLQADPRDGIGNGPSRRARRAGRVPGVIYGHGEPGIAVSVDTKEFNAIVHHPGLITFQVAGQAMTGVIKEVQRNPISGQYLHVDFLKVGADEIITIPVDIEAVGTPAGAIQGGQVEQVMHRIELKVMAKNIFEVLKVDVSAMALGDSLLVKDLVLPAGATFIVDGTLPVIHVRQPKSEDVAAAEGEGAEPEVIAKGKKEEADAKTAAAAPAAAKKK